MLEGESFSRRYEAFLNSEEAAEKLGLSVETLFFYCQHLNYTGYVFRKDLHRRYVFIQEDLLLLKVFVNLLARGITIKRAAKESVKLTEKFGVQEALRLSKLASGHIK
ncbi:MerR family transcriptional regulator [Bacillus songklensis]|uniref:MerR family transcriptional regulator n=1 Tax=Bacillus songklensis TaxID=1069116 RepID=A0ABV8AY78_9BACI